MTEASGASVDVVDSASDVVSFDVIGAAAGAGSLDVDDDADVAVGNFLVDPLSFRCIRCLTVFIFVEVKAIKKCVNLIA